MGREVRHQVAIGKKERCSAGSQEAENTQQGQVLGLQMAVVTALSLP